ncbi:unnamed protein product [Didymodactylos carnosus]|uniref:Uncharacterized protein n=1 Tax=Didymodactylos carnosus TaxID=1234261 RepID=A0A8S2D741_9BILA|nr:unnamed protein product [Didymodactylos carnosus]CAF3611053.1 unnamed protein product [Didymodactylos carnosus]
MAEGSNRCPSEFRHARLSRNFNETVAHSIHSMTVQDLKIFNEHATEQNRVPTIHVKRVKPSGELCKCLLDVEHNDVLDAVKSYRYENGRQITVLQRQIQKFRDSKSWKLWKNDLLHYYKEESLQDAAKYLYCAAKEF